MNFGNIITNFSYHVVLNLKIRSTSFETAVKYAIIGNIIDFSPIYNTQIKDIDKWFENIDQLKLAINQLEE